MKISKIIETEINDFLTGQVKISDGYYYSHWKLVKRILIYANGYYPDGKIDSQGDYKFWFDIINPRVDSEVKNIDFDTKDVLIFTDPPHIEDSTPLFLANAKLRKWLRDTGQGSQINDAIEDGALWGNVIWKKIKGGYDRLDLKNTYIINQTARTLDETPVIERHEMTQSDLREKSGVWKNIDTVIKNCGKKMYSSKRDDVGDDEKKTQTPYYEIYERNGEISEQDLFEAQGSKKKGREEIYILAKIVVAGLKLNTKDKKDKDKILYAKKISKMPYKEYHRGRYTGRWMRKGICEILFDIQTRANEIGNQLAKGLEYALKVILSTPDKLIARNVMSDMLNGDIIKTEHGLKQVLMQVPGLVAATTEWNKLMTLADSLCNSYEIIQGANLPSGVPFRLGALMNLNANKLFNFIREKLGLALEAVIGEWIIPDLIKDLKGQEVLELTGNSDFMNRYHRVIAKAWYIKNLIRIGVHTKIEADILIESKIKELQERPRSLIKYERDLFIGFKPKTKVVITGENIRLAEELESYGNFIKLEADPVRRSALIEKAMMLRGIDVASLPKSTPEQMSRGLKVAPETAPQPA